MFLKMLEGLGLMATSPFYSQLTKPLSEKIHDIKDYIFVITEFSVILGFMGAMVFMIILGHMAISDVHGISELSKIFLRIGFIVGVGVFVFTVAYQKIQPVMNKDASTHVEHAYVDKSIMATPHMKAKQTKDGIKMYQDEGISTLLGNRESSTYYISDVKGINDYKDLRTGDKIAYKSYYYKGKKVVHILDRQENKMEPLKKDVVKKGQIKVKTLTREQGDITKLNDMDIKNYKVLGNESSGIFNQDYLMKKVKIGDVLDVEITNEHNNVYDNKSIKINKIKRGGETIK